MMTKKSGAEKRDCKEYNSTIAVLVVITFWLV
jgi:hypothetical protein